MQKSPSASGSLLAEAVLLLDICEPLAAANAHNDGNDRGDGGGGGDADDCDDDDDTFVSAVDEAMERLSSERPSLTTTSSLVTFMAK